MKRFLGAAVLFILLLLTVIALNKFDTPNTTSTELGHAPTRAYGRQ